MRLNDLIVVPQSLEIAVKVKLVSNNGTSHDTLKGVIASELEEHLADALQRRGFKLTEVDTFLVEIA
jgi:hypothetical protein